MKVLMLNGSCNPKGCTYTALTEVGKTLTSAGIDYEIVQLGGDPVRDCIGCNQCSKNGCVFTDGGVNDFIAKARQADGFVFGTPVYYAHPSGRVLSFLDRVFYAGGSAFAGKPGAAVASARRAGTTASLDALGKYFGISDMVTVGSTYWNMVHGANAQDVEQDLEGLQTMRALGRNMAWLLHCIEAGKAAGIEYPALEPFQRTNFILLHVYGAEDEINLFRHFFHVCSVHYDHIRHRSRNFPIKSPAIPHRFTIRLSRAAAGCGQRRNMEPRMSLQE